MPRRNVRGQGSEDSGESAENTPGRLKMIPTANIRPNPGAPQPSLQESADQLERLWPLDKVVARWLGFSEEGYRTPCEEMRVGLLETMLREGCTGWKTQAGWMYEGIRKKLRDRSRKLHFLTSSEGGVVFWLWTLGQDMRGEEIAAYLSMYLPVYYPFVHQNSLSAITALAAYRRVQDVSEWRGHQSLQHALCGC